MSLLLFPLPRLGERARVRGRGDPSTVITLSLRKSWK
jgi:hypothetical protein